MIKKELCRCNQPRKIRLGKDIGLKLKITTEEGEKIEEIDLSLELIDPKGFHMPIDSWEIVTDNEIQFGMRGTEFKYLGFYNLTIWRNKGKVGQTMVDSLRVFELVKWTPYEEEAKTCE